MTQHQQNNKAKILDGKALSLIIRERIKQQINAHLEQGGQRPGLAVVLVGNNPASKVYVRNKHQACVATGIYSQQIELPADTSTEDLLQTVEQLNADDSIHGVLVQLPLPESVDSQQVLEHIKASKDVDGFNAMNMGRLVLRDLGIRPCTPRGVMALLHHHGIDTKGKHAVVVGASNIVGRPMALELLLDGATVTVCHRFTQGLQQHVEQAEILVAAVGKRGIIDANWIPDNCIVVDVAMNRSKDGVLCGDLDADIVQRKASWYTPVPGGVGPMTVAMLLQNTVEAAGL